MRNMKIIFLGMLIAAVCAHAGGAASIVAKKSTAKGFKYSAITRKGFIEECVHGANERVCYCVLGKIQQQYSENDYWKLEKDLQNNIKHPDYITYVSNAVEECDKEYDEESAKKESSFYGGIFGGGGGGISTRSR